MGRRRTDSLPLAALDMGTSKTCIAAGELKGAELICKSIATLPSQGMRKGAVTDPDACSAVVSRVLGIARAESGLPINEISVSVSGISMEMVESSGTVNIRGSKISHEETERAIGAAAAVSVADDREILHVAPCGFVVDGTTDTDDPVGMEAVSLEARVLVITGALHPVRQVVSCLEKAGLSAGEIILQSLAAAESSLTAGERAAGVAVADIGGGTTDISIFHGGWLRHAHSIPVSGFHLTNDLAIGLGVTFAMAEEIKKARGTVLHSDGAVQGNPPAGDGEDGSHTPTHARIAEILKPRAEEIIELIDERIALVNGAGWPVTSLVLTGGSALLTGLDRLAESMLGMPVRIGQPNAPAGLPQGRAGAPLTLSLPGEAASPAYAAVVGLLIRSAALSLEMDQALHRQSLSSRIISALSNLFGRERGVARGRQKRYNTR